MDEEEKISYLKKWEAVQNDLKSLVIKEGGWVNLEARYLGGVDMSFIKGDDGRAAAAYVLIECLRDTGEMKIVYKDMSIKEEFHDLVFSFYQKIVELLSPYIPGFLAFREADPLVRLIKKQTQEKLKDIRPEVVFVDGNGILHPQRCGLACHIGLSLDIPSIGVAKNLYHLYEDGVQNDSLHKEKIRTRLLRMGDYFPITGKNEEMLGVALRTTQESKKPLYISTGHKIDVITAKDLVLSSSLYRIPEPTRQADIISREFIRNYLCN